MRTLMLITSIFGLLVVNSLFLYGSYKSGDMMALWNDPVSAALMIEGFGLMIVFTFYFYNYPIKKLAWYWFPILSLLGSVLFALPLFFYFKLKQKQSPPM